MWIQFALATLLCAALLYVPGYLVSRTFSSDRIGCAAFAPVMTLALYEIICILCGALGTRTTALSLLMQALAAVLVVCVTAFFLKKRSVNRGAAYYSEETQAVEGHAATEKTRLREELTIYLPYIVFACLICALCFVKPLDGPNSFAGKTDNTYHLNLIRSFVDTGDWSLLHANIYYGATWAGLGAGSYYPAVWHILPTMLCELLGCQPSLATNALITVLLILMIPTSVYLFLRTVLYKKKPFALRLGAVVPLSFGVYPWQLIMETKLPFLLGVTVSIVTVSLFISYCESALAGNRRKLTLLAFAFALVTSAIVHPISLFSTGVICVPYVAWTIWRAVTAKEKTKKSKSKAIALIVLFFALVCVIWTACYYAPGMRAITVWAFEPYASVSLAVTEAILLGFKNFPPEIFLALLVWLGMYYSVYRRRYLWLSFVFLFGCGQFILGAVSDGFLTHFLTGFWYSDYKRVATTACITAMPLAALGLEIVVRTCQLLFAKLTHGTKRDECFGRVTVPLTCALLALAIIFYPSFKLPGSSHKTPTTFGRITKELRDWNSFTNSYSVLSADELEFLDQVKEVTGDDVVLNVPLDGSAFAYAEDDINVAFRRYGPFNSQQQQIIRARLCNVASDSEVRETVEELDARYVVLLDTDFDDRSTFFPNGTVGAWPGFINLDEQTPGFDLVLSEGDMRLYRIEDEAA